MKVVITLQMYKPLRGSRGLAYDEKGGVVNEHQLVRLVHGIPEWYNFLANMKNLGFFRSDVVNVTVDGVVDLDKIPEYQKEVSNSLNGKKEELTADQIKIKELEEKLNAFMSKGVEVEDDKELMEARAAYFQKFGEKGKLNWTAKTIYSKIQEG